MQESNLGFGWRQVAVIGLLLLLILSPLAQRWYSHPSHKPVEVTKAPVEGAEYQLGNPRARAPKAIIVETPDDDDSGDILVVLAPLPRPQIVLQNYARIAPPLPAPSAPPEAIPTEEPTAVAEQPIELPLESHAAVPAIEALAADDQATPVPQPSPVIEPAPAQPKGQNLEKGQDSSVDESAHGIKPAEVPTAALPLTPWPTAISLIKQLEDLQSLEPNCADWSKRCLVQLASLPELPTLTDSQAGQIIGRLDALAIEAKQFSKTLTNEETKARLLRAGYAVARRVAFWKPTFALAQETVPTVAPDASREHLQSALTAVQADLGRSNSALAWQKYLRLERIQKELLASDSEVTAENRQLARLILHKLHSNQLSPPQLAFLNNTAIVSLESELRHWAHEPLDFSTILRIIEDYEAIGLTAQSQALANVYDQLSYSGDPEMKQLSDVIDNYYRNANVRLAVAAHLVNRALPQQQVTAEPVNDYIQEAYVQGDSETRTNLRVVLLPDRTCWRLGLEASGQVASATQSTSGPATFWQDGAAYYRARKLLVVDRGGFHLFNAEAKANSNSELTGYETNYDGVPILGSIARSIAKSQYDQKSPLAKLEVEQRIIGRASGQLDREVSGRVEKARQDLHVRLLDPLQKLDLDPTPIELETTQDRLIGRYRLAGHDQVSAHTPRPQAPGDSLLSVQIHESALNNAVNHLGLSGRRVELQELYTELSHRFRVPGKKVEMPDDLPEEVYVTFAEQDPIRVDCEDGRVKITIRLKELSQGTKNKWKDFVVKGYYKPDGDQRDANLVRDGIIELSGHKLRIADRTVLNGIFARVMSRNRKLNLVNNQLADSPQLKDQQVTQFVIYDGWLGIALGPKLPGRGNMAIKPSNTTTRSE